MCEKKKRFQKGAQTKEEKIKKGDEKEVNTTGDTILGIWIRRRSSFHRGRDGRDTEDVGGCQ